MSHFTSPMLAFDVAYPYSLESTFVPPSTVYSRKPRLQLYTWCDDGCEIFGSILGAIY